MRASASLFPLIMIAINACDRRQQTPLGPDAESQSQQSMLASANSIAAGWSTILTPYIVDPFGSSAANLNGQFRMGDLTGVRIFLGTDAIRGRLVMRFDGRCKSGAGAFGVKTASEGFGPLGGAVRVDFYDGKQLRRELHATIRPATENVLSVRAGTTFDRVVLTNTAPDPPGVNNDATITLDNAWCVFRK